MTAASSPTDLVQRANELEEAARILVDQAKILRRAVERQAEGRREVALLPLPPLLSKLASTNGTEMPVPPMPNIEDLAIQVAVILQEQDMLPKEIQGDHSEISLEEVVEQVVPQVLAVLEERIVGLSDRSGAIDLDEVKDSVYERVQKEILSSGELTKSIRKVIENLDLEEFLDRVYEDLVWDDVYSSLAKNLAERVYKALVVDSKEVAVAIAEEYFEQFNVTDEDVHEGLAIALERKLNITVSA